MVAYVLRLRAALLIGALRGDRRHVVATIVGIVLLLAATVAASLALLSLRAATPEVAFVVTVLGGSAVTLGFALAPLIVGAADPLDPRRFAVFGVRDRPLAGALALAGLISVPTLILVVLAICIVVVWAAHGVPWIVGVIVVILAAATCVLLARVSMALTSLVLRERRSRELSGIFAIGILVVVVPVGVFLSSLEWRGTVPTQLQTASDILAVTPFGAPWGFIGGFGSGAGSPWWSLIVALLTVGALAAAWWAVVHRLLTTTERPASVREHGGLGWFAITPGTPGGAIAARSLIYWLRDPRYLLNLLAIPVGAAVTTVPLLVAGVPPEVVALVPVPIIALFLGWMPHNDLAYDSTAVWMHIASGTRGVADRAGRLIPVVLVAIPTLAILIPVAITLHGRWAALPAMVGVCACLLLSGLGLSSIASVVAPYAVSNPGDSPFQQPQRAGTGGVISQGVVLLGVIVVTVPVFWWAWLALTDDISTGLVALWGGIGIGLVVLIVGIAIGARVFVQRGDRLMEFAEAS